MSQQETLISPENTSTLHYSYQRFLHNDSKHPDQIRHLRVRSRIITSHTAAPGNHIIFKTNLGVEVRQDFDLNDITFFSVFTIIGLKISYTKGNLSKLIK